MLACDYPVSLICQVVCLPRSSYYYSSSRRDETLLIAAIEDAAAQFPTYGSRRLTHQVKREVAALKPLGRKRVGRIMRENGLILRRKKQTKQTTNSRHSYPRYPNLVKGMVVTHPEEVWVSDITYIKLGNGQFIYLAIVMDVFTRAIRGWALSQGLGVELSLAALNRAMECGKPEIHHSDQGVQYAATEYVAILKRAD